MNLAKGGNTRSRVANYLLTLTLTPLPPKCSPELCFYHLRNSTCASQFPYQSCNGYILQQFKQQFKQHFKQQHTCMPKSLTQNDIHNYHPNTQFTQARPKHTVCTANYCHRHHICLFNCSYNNTYSTSSLESRIPQICEYLYFMIGTFLRKSALIPLCR